MTRSTPSTGAEPHRPHRVGMALLAAIALALVAADAFAPATLAGFTAWGFGAAVPGTPGTPGTSGTPGLHHWLLAAAVLGLLRLGLARRVLDDSAQATAAPVADEAAPRTLPPTQARLAWINAAGNCQAVSEGLAALFDLAPEDLAGACAADLFGPLNAPALGSALRAALAGDAGHLRLGADRVVAVRPRRVAAHYGYVRR